MQGIGFKQASEKLGVYIKTLYARRKDYRNTKTTRFSAQDTCASALRMRKMSKLQKENRELKHANEILKKAPAFFAKNRKP